MGKRIFVAMLMAIALIDVSRVEAQERRPEPISFSSALQQTIMNNLSVKAKNYEFMYADKQRKATASLRSPQIALMANYTFLSEDIAVDLNSAKPAVKGVIGSINPVLVQLPAISGMLAKDWSKTLQDDNFGLVGATVKVPIFMGGKINAAYGASKIKLEEVKEQTEEVKGLLFNELVERYFGLAISNELIRVRAQVVEGMQHHYDNAVELEKNGVIANGEKLYAHMFLTKAIAEYNKAKRDAQTINFALSNTLNNASDFMPTTPLFVLPRLEDIDFYKQSALELNSKLKQVRLKVELTKQGVKSARAEFMPHLTAIGGVNIVDHQVADVLPRAVAGVNLSFNIFNGLNREFKYSASKMRVKQVETLEQKGAEDISMLVDKLYNELLSLSEQYFSYESTIKFANEYLRIKERAFAEGLATSSDVVDAQLNLAKNKIERLQIAYQYDVTLGKLMEVCGRYSDFEVLINDEKSIKAN